MSHNCHHKEYYCKSNCKHVYYYPVPGPQGPIGPQGAIGTIGPIGLTGPEGPVGTMGPIGLTGTMGPIGLTGTIGPIGLTGTMGPIGLTGTIGPIGLTGTMGPIGLTGTIGPIGLTGPEGATGTMGPIGLTGTMGSIGLTGPRGIAGGLISVADFYALMPDDNDNQIAPGTSIEFPHDGPASGTIVRNNATQFILPDIGIYEVNFQVSVSEAGQLVVVLDGTELLYTVVGRATRTTQIVGLCLVKTTLLDSVLSINNPLGNPSALTITTDAGGTEPVSAHLVIKRVV